MYGYSIRRIVVGFADRALSLRVRVRGYGYDRYGRMGIVPDDSGWGLYEKIFIHDPLGPHG